MALKITLKIYYLLYVEEFHSIFLFIIGRYFILPNVNICKEFRSTWESYAVQKALRSQIFFFFFCVFLKKKKNIYFNRRLITLQYCGGFCHTSTCVPPSWTPLPPSSPSHPSGLSQHTGFGYPASCIKLVLVFYFTYSNIHVSMLFSKIIPPSPFPT